MLLGVDARVYKVEEKVEPVVDQFFDFLFFARIMRFFLNVLDGGALAQGDWPILCANGLPDVVICALCSKRVLGALANLKTTLGVEQDP